MKKLLSILFLLCFITNAAISQINSSAKILKLLDKDSGTTYYEEIKKFAEKDWKGDHVMMVHVINEQSDAFIEFGKCWNSDVCDKDIMINAISDWGQSKPTLTADWVMVMHQYKTQLEAKGAY